MDMLRPAEKKTNWAVKRKPSGPFSLPAAQLPCNYFRDHLLVGAD